MQLTLDLSLFGGALGDVRLPEFTPDDPYQAGLILEDFDDPVGIEFLEVLEITPESTKVVSRTIDPEISLIVEGSEFFVTRRGKMFGKGRIEKVGITCG